MYFGFAAVLEDPNGGHSASETPKFSFSIYDNTLSKTLYSIAFNVLNAASTGIVWHNGLTTGNGTWKYSDWNVVHVDTSILSGYNGDTFTVTVSAYDCALGGHGGYAYVHSFQNNLPVANHGSFTLLQADQLNVPEPGTILLLGASLLGLCVGGFKRLVRK